MAKMQNDKATVAQQAKQIAALEATVASLKAGALAGKLARSNIRRDAAVAAGKTPVEIAFAASSTRRGACKGEVAWYLLSHGAGMYTNAQIKKAISTGDMSFSAAQIDTALDMLVKWFDKREGVGAKLVYDRKAEKVEMVSRVPVAPKKARVARKARKLPPPPVVEGENAA